MTKGVGTDITDPEDDGQTPLDPDEVQGLLLDWVVTRDDLNTAEEQNIARGMVWGHEKAARRVVLAPDFLRELHQEMFGRVWDWAGKYRHTERNIGVAPHAISTEIQNLMDDAVAWNRFDTWPMDERAARLHHRLTAIHPFPNGNGRCSRVFADLYLEQNDTAPFTWGAGLAPDRQRALYIAALRAADAHNYAPLLTFVRQ